MPELKLPFFVFEMANNHMGDVTHGVRIVREMGAIARRFPEFHFGMKLQYRDLDTFIHPAFRGREDIKYVKRFEETRLSDADFREIVAAIHAEGMTSVCTPFDEPSVDRIEAHGIQVIKIASCSLTDWPLLERVVKTDRPIIASTAGADLADIDRVVSFYQHRERTFAIMHCVAEYPTGANGLQLNQIDFLRGRYPDAIIGYSTHEDPDNTLAVQLAMAKGARIFEKHVGVPTDAWPLNNYSASPQQVEQWLLAARQAMAMGGVEGSRAPATEAERASLASLQRGIFARRAIQPGETISSADVYFAFPPSGNQWRANDWSKYRRFVAKAPIAPDAPLAPDTVDMVDGHVQVYKVAREVKEMLQRAHVQVPGGAELEISHHYGLDRFQDVGLTMITVVNREYCKKLLVMLPGQAHPEQYHAMKEETFHVLHGGVEVSLDGKVEQLGVGDVVTIAPGVRHALMTRSGVVIEELSTNHQKDDSYYTDPAIVANGARKTFIKYWV